MSVTVMPQFGCTARQTLATSSTEADRRGGATEDINGNCASGPTRTKFDPHASERRREGRGVPTLDQRGLPEESNEGHSEVCVRTCLVCWAGLSRSDVVGLCAVRVLALARGEELEQTIEANEPRPDDLCALKEIIKGKPADPLTMQRLSSAIWLKNSAAPRF